MNKSEHIFTKATADEREDLYYRHDGNRGWITMVGSVGADGTSPLPLLTFKGIGESLVCSWVQDVEDLGQQGYRTTSEKGWPNNDIGFHWLTESWDRYSKPKAR